VGLLDLKARARPGKPLVAPRAPSPVTALGPTPEDLWIWIRDELPRAVDQHDPRWVRLGIDDPVRAYYNLASLAWEDPAAARPEILRWRGVFGPEGTKREERSR